MSEWLDFLQPIIVAMLAIVTAYMRTVQKSVARTETQVSNDHSSNLREELDERHAEVMDKMSENSARLEVHTKTIATIRSDVDNIMRGKNDE